MSALVGNWDTRSCWIPTNQFTRCSFRWFVWIWASVTAIFQNASWFDFYNTFLFSKWTFERTLFRVQRTEKSIIIKQPSRLIFFFLLFFEQRNKSWETLRELCCVSGIAAPERSVEIRGVGGKVNLSLGWLTRRQNCAWLQPLCTWVFDDNYTVVCCINILWAPAFGVRDTGVAFRLHSLPLWKPLAVWSLTVDLIEVSWYAIITPLPLNVFKMWFSGVFFIYFFLFSFAK